MGIRQGGGHVPRDLDRIFEGERVFADEPLAERLARDVRHHEEREAVSDAGVEQGEDVRMGKPGGEADFLLKAVWSERRQHFGADHLHGDLPAVPDVVGQEHDRHPPVPELTEDGVATSQCGSDAGDEVRHTSPFDRPRQPTRAGRKG